MEPVNGLVRERVSGFLNKIRGSPSYQSWFKKYQEEKITYNQFEEKVCEMINRSTGLYPTPAEKKFLHAETLKNLQTMLA